MKVADWITLGVTLSALLVFGFRRGSKSSLRAYIQGDSSIRRTSIAISVMATQASAITFISTPGQAFTSGMSYLQLYFGMPIAMAILALVVAPRYVQAGVLTAYEFLERRFDREVRVFAALLFLVQRGLASGFNFFVPALVLSLLIGAPLYATVLVLGTVITFYTAFGGAVAIARTQVLQMAIKILGLIAVVVLTWRLFPPELSTTQILRAARLYDRLNLVNFSTDPKERYTFWSGLSGGLILALAYFTADQSQVQRYLAGGSLRETQLGLLLNGILKIPLQFLVLSAGVIVFLFYRFYPEPINFHPLGRALLAHDQAVSSEYSTLWEQEKTSLLGYLHGNSGPEEVLALDAKRLEIRKRADKEVTAQLGEDTQESDYIFLSFIIEELPIGMAGIFIAAVLSAALSTAASEMSALGASSAIDLYAKLGDSPPSEEKLVAVAKWMTVVWGGVAIAFAFVLSHAENLIQGINILGSLFYGVMLGMFFLAFLPWRPRSRILIGSALLSEAIVIALHFRGGIGFLWYNAIGFASLVLFASIATLFARKYVDFSGRIAG